MNEPTGPAHPDAAPPARPHRYLASRDDWADALAAHGQPAFRTNQVWEHLYAQRRPLETATTVPRALLATLVETFPVALTTLAEQRSEHDGTTKWLFAGRNGAQVETVLMPNDTRATVCVSSQAGCAMACSFCATGQAGFQRHLDAGEIVEQVLRAQHATEARVGNVVFMGMGEPLANLDAVLPAIERLHGDCGISARHITVSTVGIVPGIDALREFPLPVTLAVSLHAPGDGLRSELVPINQRYPIHSVLDAAREYALEKGRRVTFEYACIDGVNLAPHLARALADLLRDFPAGAHVNLIPLNATSGYRHDAGSADAVRAFSSILRERGVGTTIRRNRGRDIAAACGQLRAREGARDPSRPPARMPS